MAVNTTFTSGAILTAAQMNALPFGLVAEPIVITSNQTGITTNTDVTGASITFTGIAGRKYKASFVSLYTSATASIRVSYSVTDGSNTQQIPFIFVNNVAGTDQTATGSYTFTATGSTTRKLRISPSSNTVAITAGSGFPTQFWIEDIGTA
jgi:hypothetical protein